LQYPTAHPDTDYGVRAEVTGINLEEGDGIAGDELLK
jgi:hypothetical protein